MNGQATLRRLPRIALLISVSTVMSFGCASEVFDEVQVGTGSEGQSSTMRPSQGSDFSEQLEDWVKSIVQTRELFAIDLIDAVFRDEGGAGASEEVLQLARNAMQLLINPSGLSLVDIVAKTVTYSFMFSALESDDLDELQNGLRRRLTHVDLGPLHGYKQVGANEYMLHAQRLRNLGGEQWRVPEADSNACDEVGFSEPYIEIGNAATYPLLVVGRFVHLPNDTIAILEINWIQNLHKEVRQGVLCNSIAPFAQCAAQRGAEILQLTGNWTDSRHRRKFANNQWKVYASPFLGAELPSQDQGRDAYRSEQGLGQGLAHILFADIPLTPFQCIDGLSQLADGELPYRLTEFDASDFTEGNN